MIRIALRAAAAASLLLLAACGGGNAPDGAQGSDGLAARILVSPQAPGIHCDTGGSRIDAGLDANRNGVLDADEIGSTQYVCHGAAGDPGAAGPAGATGAAGSPGASALVVMTDEAAGVNCAQGGKRIAVGPDSDGDGTLDPTEVSSTGYVCHGLDGTNGANGTNGTNGVNGVYGISTLLSVVPEVAGANCAYGGSTVRSGADSNANGVLDAGEVTSTSFVCDGAPGPGVVWNVVSAATQAQVQNGYLAANDYAQVAITLPASAVAGQTVRITGAGAGGWKVVQNAGQTINGRTLGVEAGVQWTARENVRNWNVVASSADGNRLIAAAWGGAVYISTDRGLSWTVRFGDAPRQWYGVASSADGVRLVAVEFGGTIHTSTDGGVTWTARMTDMPRDWYAVASSADGQTLVAAVSGGTLYVSTDAGVNWTARATDTARDWMSVASSADGTRLVAAVFGGAVHTSVDSGVTWTARTADAWWSAVASSADGMRLVAAGAGEQIHTSTDGGATWTPRDSARDWVGVASSSDGRRLVAVAMNGGTIYTSTDAGASWTARETARQWYGCASSAAGDTFVAVAAADRIYVSTAWSTFGTAGSIAGGAYDSVELQSLGDGRFNVIGHEGSLTVE